MVIDRQRNAYKKIVDDYIKKLIYMGSRSLSHST